MKSLRESQKKMLKEKVGYLSGVLDVITQIKYSILDKRVKMLDKIQDESKKYHLIDGYRGVIS
jgi:ACT domain-containing protein